MKKLLFIFSLFVTTFTFATSGELPNETSENNSNQNIIGIAMGAIRSECDNAIGELQAQVQTISACFAGGFVNRVTFYSVPNCPPNQFCIQVIQVVGSVTLDCDNNVLSVDCGLVSL